MVAFQILQVLFPALRVTVPDDEHAGDNGWRYWTRHSSEEPVTASWNVPRTILTVWYEWTNPVLKTNLCARYNYYFKSIDKETRKHRVLVTCSKTHASRCKGQDFNSAVEQLTHWQLLSLNYIHYLHFLHLTLNNAGVREPTPSTVKNPHVTFYSPKTLLFLGICGGFVPGPPSIYRYQNPHILKSST